MAGILRVPVLVQSSGRRPSYNIWHMNSPSSTLADAQAAVDALRDFYTTAATLYQNTTTITIGNNVVEITAVPQTIWPVVNRTVVGTTAGSAAPYQLANVLSLRTAFAGKSRRGRAYLGPIADASITGSVLNAPVMTAIGNAATTLIATGLVRVWSEKLLLATAVTGYLSNNTLETQRRRARN